MKRLVLVVILALTMAQSAFAQNACFKGQKPEKPIYAACDSRLLKYDEAGNLVWKYDKDVAPLMGDLQLLPNGNLLFADGAKAQEITQDGKVVFTFIPEDNGRNDLVFSAERLDDGNTLVCWNTANKMVLVDPNGKIVKEIQCQFASPKNDDHHNLRIVRKTPRGTYWAAHKHSGTVAEYAEDCTFMRKFVLEGKDAYAVQELPSGEIMATYLDCIVIFDKDCKEVWRWTNEDMAKLGVENSYLCNIFPRKNGNFVISNFACNTGDKHLVCMFEFTRDKQVVWYYQNPEAPTSFMGVVVEE